MGSKDEKVKLLRNVDLFGRCSNKELARIASLVDEIDVEPGTILTQEGRPGHEFFAIALGTAEVSLRGKELAKLGPGEFFGEMALLDRGPRATTVKALTPMHLYVLSAQNFASLIEQTPAVARGILRGMAQRLRAVEGAPTY